MTPGLAEAIFAGVTLFILWTVTVLGGGVWLMSQLKTLKTEILADFDSKHKANEMTVKALNELVIRHDTILNPEWRSELANGQRRRHD